MFFVNIFKFLYFFQPDILKIMFCACCVSVAMVKCYVFSGIAISLSIYIDLAV